MGCCDILTLMSSGHRTLTRLRQALPASLEADRTACSSASVSVANLLIAMTTGTPYFLAFWMCLHVCTCSGACHD